LTALTILAAETWKYQNIQVCASNCRNACVPVTAEGCRGDFLDEIRFGPAGANGLPNTTIRQSRKGCARLWLGLKHYKVLKQYIKKSVLRRFVTAADRNGADIFLQAVKERPNVIF